jgi:hypothetical protein
MKNIKKVFKLINYTPILIWMFIVNIILLIEKVPFIESLLVNGVLLFGIVGTILCGLMYPRVLKD